MASNEKENPDQAKGKPLDLTSAFPEVEAELKDLEEYKREETETFNYRILRQRKVMWLKKRRTLTRFNCAEVHWMDALNEMASDQGLLGFPKKNDAEMYADGRWLIDYEAGLTTRQSLQRYKKETSGESR